ncbi:hypothetical protein HDU80_009114, partial [Chytriomyces hyalinus]
HDGDGNGKIQWAQDCDFNGGDYAHYNVPAEQCSAWNPTNAPTLPGTTESAGLKMAATGESRLGVPRVPSAGTSVKEMMVKNVGITLTVTRPFARTGVLRAIKRVAATSRTVKLACLDMLDTITVSLCLTAFRVGLILIVQAHTAVGTWVGLSGELARIEWAPAARRNRK